MIAGWEVPFVVLGLVGAAISSGAFFAFSNFVMPALGRLPRDQGAAAMQAVNVAAPTPTFVASIVGAGLIGVPVVVAEIANMDQAGPLYVLAGTVLSLTSLVVTVTANVPRNDALDRVDVSSQDGQEYWAAYLSSWTRWNTVRTITSLGSVAAYALALHS